VARGIFGGASVALGGTALVIMPYVPGIPAKIALTTIGVALPSVIYVIGNAIVSEIAPVAQRGAMLAIGTAVSTSAGLLGPYVIGSVVETAVTPLNRLQHRLQDLWCHHAGRRRNRDGVDAPGARDDTVDERNPRAGSRRIYDCITRASLTASVIGNSECLADRGVATRASREGPGESDDEASSHGRDRVWDVALGSDRRRLWVGNRREWQIAGAAQRKVVLRGEGRPVRRSRTANRCPDCNRRGSPEGPTEMATLFLRRLGFGPGAERSEPRQGARSSVGRMPGQMARRSL
jgi:hypothetical protein